MSKQTKHFYEFGAFRVDPQDRLLLKEGKVVPLAPKVFDILLIFLEHPGSVLEKDSLLERVWPDTFVEEGNLARNVSTLRKVLGEVDEGAQFIETIPRRGYRFVATVKSLADDSLTVIVQERSHITIEEEVEFDQPTTASSQNGSPQERLTTSFALTDLGRLPENSIQSLPSGSESRSRHRPQVSFSPLTMVIWSLFIGVIGVCGGAVFLQKPQVPNSLPVFRQVSFRNGMVWSARFLKDGATILYSAAWEGNPGEIFSLRPETPESRPFGLSDVYLAAVSSTGELAVITHPGPLAHRGTLARVSFSGSGAPREVLDNVFEADWSSDGKELAVIHFEDGKFQLQFPIGKTLYEAPLPGWISNVRISPTGEWIAFINHPAQAYDSSGSIFLINQNGNKRKLSSDWTSLSGLAWSPSGSEIWFTASAKGINCDLYAVNLDGQERQLVRVPGSLTIYDISAQGQVLLAREDWRTGIMCLPPGATQERDLSWLDGSWLRDLSTDGQQILFDEEGEGGGETASVYLRHTDGSPAVRLGDGFAISLSPNGKWALARYRHTKPPQLVLIPTGVGQPQTIPAGAIEFREYGNWFPDSQRLVLFGREPGHKPRLYTFDLETNVIQPLTPEGITGRPLSPDGRTIVVNDASRNRFWFSVETGEMRPFPVLEPHTGIICWSADGRSLFLVQGENPLRISRFDIETGHKEFLREIRYFDQAGLISMIPILYSADGKSYAYTYVRKLSNLYLLDIAR
ncbi:MAG: winged helix-turn-helix domain-containing protein [Acidobacteria bacterium]|nr:winged helix-turn-helix domain-containing protein [Acidobacteriota bacterium]